MKRLRYVLAAAMLTLSGVALAGESLINGDPLQYNHDYRCNGERISVGRCRDNDDSSYCQVYYPDRPYHNGMMVQPVEMRGDIIHKLAACTPPPRTQAAPRQVSTSVATTHAAAAPGLGQSRWRALYITRESATFFTSVPATSRANSANIGWFTTVFAKPEDFPDSEVSGAEFFQGRQSANCAGESLALLQSAWYDENKKLLRGGVDPHPSFEPVSPGTLGAAKLNILCGRPQPLVETKPLIGDGDYLWFYYHARLDAESNRTGNH